MIFRKKLNLSIYLFFALFLTGCSTQNLSKFYGSEELKINNNQLKRIQSYFKGEYYSYHLKRKVFAAPVMLALSEDGASTLLIGCEGIDQLCDPNVLIYQLLKRYSKKSESELKIFALGNKVVWSKKNYYIYKGNLDKINELFVINNFKKEKNKYYDYIIDPTADKCNSDDC